MTFHAVPLAPMAHPRLDLFLLGYIAAVSAVAALYFLRFWKETHDFLFVAFAVFFIVHGGSRVFALSAESPNVVIGWVHFLRFLGLLLVVGAILRKNYRHE